MDGIIDDILMNIANAFLSMLIGKVGDELWEKLKEKIKSDPTLRAFKQALAVAIQNYAASSLRLLVPPLLAKNSFLAQSEIALELTKLIRFDGEPDYERVGKAWKAAMDDPPPGVDFSVEARRFLA